MSEFDAQLANIPWPKVNKSPMFGACRAFC